MFHHIVVPLDGSTLAECVLPHTLALAQMFDSKVTVLHVLEQRRGEGHTRAVDPLGWQLRVAEAEAYLGRVTQQLEGAGVRATSRILEGNSAEKIVDLAHREDVDLVVLSTHGQSGLTGWNVSSVVQKIVARDQTSTLLVRAYQPIADFLSPMAYRRVLAPLDGSKRAEDILPLATVVAARHEATLLLAHVVRRPEMPRHMPPSLQDVELAERLTERNREEAEQYLQLLQSRTPHAETRLLVNDDVPMALHDLIAAEGVEMVLLTAHGYSGKRRWPYGSVSNNLIAYGTTPLLILQDLAANEMEESRAEAAAREYAGYS